MVKTDGVVALVPARGGSKSIPRKNLRPFGGLPLIAYSIEAGRAARRVDRVIVSTDDPDIAAVARRFGAEVPFMRPSSLAGDTTADLPVFQHALEWLEAHDGWQPQIVVQLRPTSPLRPPGCVDEAVALLHGDSAADSVRSVVPAAQNPYKMWRLDDGAMRPLLEGMPGEPWNQPRQSLPATYWQSGHVDAIRAETIRRKGSMTGARIRPLFVDPAYTCDIDSEIDWQRGEWTLAHLERPFVAPPHRDPRLPDHIALIVLDFDGVITDNRVWVTETGQEWVACNRSDGLGLEQLRQLGIGLLVLSTETNPVVTARCRKLRLECEQGLPDKGARLRAVLDERGLDPAAVVYLGNDVNDLACFRLVGCAVAVADAHPDVLSDVDLVLTRRGGDGAVRELCDRVRTHLAARIAATAAPRR